MKKEAKAPGDTCHLPASPVMASKHEIISCERCRRRIECKANAYTKCQCSGIQLNLNEVQYVSENYEGCLCAQCLADLRDGYQAALMNASPS